MGHVGRPPRWGALDPPANGIHASRPRGDRAHLIREQGVNDMTTPAVVLVHGGFVDGSGWEPLYRILRQDGHDVSVVQNPTTSLADDVAVTRRVLDQHEQVILVGHSYGGAVITEAGNHPNV